jgi:hypothetical protein
MQAIEAEHDLYVNETLHLGIPVSDIRSNSQADMLYSLLEQSEASKGKFDGTGI